MTRRALIDLQRAPGVGPSIALDLYDLGMRPIDDVAAQDPQRLYDELCELRGERIDRCALYVFRCAVYWAGNQQCTHQMGARQPDAELSKWWSCKGGDVAETLLERA